MFYIGSDHNCCKSYVEVTEDEAVELVDVVAVADVVIVVGRAFATAQIVAHNITENFMPAAVGSRKSSCWNSVPSYSREQFYTALSSSRLFPVVHQNSLSYFVIAVHLPDDSAAVSWLQRRLSAQTIGQVISPSMSLWHSGGKSPEWSDCGWGQLW